MPLSSRKRSVLLLVTCASIGFLIVGIGNQFLALFPVQLGIPEWEIAFFGQFSANLALPMIGAMGLGGVAVGTGRRALAVGLGAGLVLLGVVAGLGVLLVGLDLPLVWNLTAGSSAVEATGYRLVTLKALILCGLYAMMNMALAWRTLRSP